MTDLDVRALRDRLGQEIAVGDRHGITQAAILHSAEATGDHQWIQADAVRAASGCAV